MKTKKYYCKKSYDSITIGNYYDCGTSTNDLIYEISGKNKKGFDFNMIYDNKSDIYKYFNDYLILAIIHDRKIKLEKIRLS